MSAAIAGEMPVARTRGIPRLAALMDGLQQRPLTNADCLHIHLI